MMAAVLTVSTACEPDIALEVTNRTQEVLYVFVNNVEHFSVDPGGTARGERTLWLLGKYRIEGRTKTGRIVYIRDFDPGELADIDGRIVIQPGPPLEVTNRTQETLYVYVDGVLQFTVGPGATVAGDPRAWDSMQAIEMRTDAGRAVYSRTFYRWELYDIGFKIVVPPMTPGQGALPFP